MAETKEMEMLKELLRDTCYGREFDVLAFMANNTCEALGHLREWIKELQAENAELRSGRLMEQAEKWRKQCISLRSRVSELEGILEAVKGLVHYHYKVCNIDDQSEDEIAQFIDKALKRKSR